MSDAAPFVVSAPGKTIVFGEHAVVHGKAAIAAALSLRSYLLITPLHAEAPVTLSFPDVGLEHSWLVKELPWSAAHGTHNVNDRVTSLDKDHLSHLHPLVEAVSPEAPQEERKIHQAATLTFLYLLLSLRSSDMQPCSFAMRSTIPIASGLGSSASISVCIATALLSQGGHLSDPTSQLSHEQCEQMLNMINHWAFVGELCIHGTPSGLDNTIATRGKAVWFKRQGGGKPSLVKPIPEFPALPLLLVDTKVPRSTATEVAKVKTLMDTHPQVTDLMLDAINSITESVHELILSPAFDSNDAESVKKLGELARMNHGILVSLGVSHPKLERIRELIDHAGIGWTKLTGAGGGGCAITILKPDVSPESLHKLEEDVAKEGFARYETILGARGVGILRSGVETITRQIFLGAKSNEEVEELVGTKKGSWLHWE